MICFVLILLVPFAGAGLALVNSGLGRCRSAAHGWLAQLGTNCGLGRGFVDGGGASTIQVVGGLTALSITWILGPRRGKFSSEGIPAAMPGHNAVLVITGCFVAWIGWIALNSAGALLF